MHKISRNYAIFLPLDQNLESIFDAGAWALRLSIELHFANWF